MLCKNLLGLYINNRTETEGGDQNWRIIPSLLIAVFSLESISCLPWYFLHTHLGADLIFSLGIGVLFREGFKGRHSVTIRCRARAILDDVDASFTYANRQCPENGRKWDGIVSRKLNLQRLQINQASFWQKFKRWLLPLGVDIATAVILDGLQAIFSWHSPLHTPTSIARRYIVPA